MKLHADGMQLLREPLGWGWKKQKEVGIRRSEIRLSVDTRVGCGRGWSASPQEEMCSYVVCAVCSIVLIHDIYIYIYIFCDFVLLCVLNHGTMRCI